MCFLPKFPPLEQCRWQAGGNFGRKQILVECALVMDHLAWILSKQQADLVLGLLDLLLKCRDGLGSGIYELLGLALIEQRGNAARLTVDREVQRILPSSECGLRNLQFVVQPAYRVVRSSDIA